MNRLEQKRMKTEQGIKEQAIRIVLFSIDYYLMGLFRACEAGDEREVESSKKMLEELRGDLIRLGYYAEKKR